MKAEIHAKLQRFGVSGPGREWLLRALHPASEDKSPGLPDQSAAAVLRPDFRIQSVIQPPPGADTWDCYIWTPPGDVNTVYWATGPSGTDFTAILAPAGCQIGIINLQKSSYTTNAFSFETTSTPPAPFDAVTSLPNMAGSSFRHQFKSITVSLVAAAVADQGTVYAAQFAPNVQHIGLVTPNYYQTGGSGVTSLYGSMFSTVLPASEDKLAAMAPDFYMSPARDGVYMPLRLSGPSQPFVRAVPSGWGFISNGATYYPIQDITFLPLGAVLQPTENIAPSGPNTIPWVFRAMTTDGLLGPLNTPLVPANGVSSLQFDTGYDNMNIGVIIFRGLAGSGGGGFGASLQVKVIDGLEIVPNPTSVDRVFAEPAAPYEPKALEAYYSVVMELKDAYPSSFNSLEDIWGSIKSAVSSVWNKVGAPIFERVTPKLIDAGEALVTRGLGSLMAARAPRLSMPRVTYRAPSAARSASMRSVSQKRRAPARAKPARKAGARRR